MQTGIFLAKTLCVNLKLWSSSVPPEIDHNLKIQFSHDTITASILKTNHSFPIFLRWMSYQVPANGPNNTLNWNFACAD